MIRKIGLMITLALIGFACAEGVGHMLQDAGQTLQDAGNMIGDGSVPDAGAQQSKSVSCDRALTLNGDPWNGYALVDVGNARFPDVTIRTTWESWADFWGNRPEYGGFAPGEYVSEYHGTTFVGGKLVVSCNGTEESITVFY